MTKQLLKNTRIYAVVTLLLLASCTSQTQHQKEETLSNSNPSTALPMEVKERQAQTVNESIADLETQQQFHRAESQKFAPKKTLPAQTSLLATGSMDILRAPALSYSRESYNSLQENGFVRTMSNPLSTFSVDVDTASYANIRRWIKNGQLPPVGAVRLEEMVNYFTYDYPLPTGKPLAVVTELGPCPWAPEHKLVRIGIQAKKLKEKNIPPSNLVFLIDVSGSMNHPNKLPLLKKSMLLLTDQLNHNDRVAIVVYAGSDRIVLPPTQGDLKEKIKTAIVNLQSGGSTHGSKGILTAYKLAKQSFLPKGNNRVILASDGDFNVGITSRGELEHLIAKEKESGIYLSVLGFGMGNYHDDTMELLADKGNGNYNYVDSILEAKKVLVKERASTLFTIATDVKVQVEFNPALVGGYRLIGYENRNLADEDFNNDKKDAGDVGAEHSITAVYELLPIHSPLIPDVDTLKYQSSPKTDTMQELLTVKLRYKPDHASQSQLLVHPVKNTIPALTETTKDFQFTCAVLGFGHTLRKSEYARLSYPQLIEMAKNGRGKDEEGYRAEFIKLLETAELINGFSKQPGKSNN